MWGKVGDPGGAKWGAAATSAESSVAGAPDSRRPNRPGGPASPTAGTPDARHSQQPAPRAADAPAADAPGIHRLNA